MNALGCAVQLLFPTPFTLLASAHLFLAWPWLRSVWTGDLLWFGGQASLKRAPSEMVPVFQLPGTPGAVLWSPHCRKWLWLSCAPSSSICSFAGCQQLR